MAETNHIFWTWKKLIKLRIFLWMSWRYKAGAEKRNKLDKKVGIELIHFSATNWCHCSYLLSPLKLTSLLDWNKDGRILSGSIVVDVNLCLKRKHVSESCIITFQPNLHLAARPDGRNYIQNPIETICILFKLSWYCVLLKSWIIKLHWEIRDKRRETVSMLA